VRPTLTNELAPKQRLLRPSRTATDPFTLLVAFSGPGEKHFQFQQARKRSLIPLLTWHC